MSKAETKVVKDVVETAAEQLLNFSERGATAYGDDVIRILKPLKDSELHEVGGHVMAPKAYVHGRDNDGTRARQAKAQKLRKRTQDEAALAMVKSPLFLRETMAMSSIAEHLRPDSRKALRDACMQRAEAEARAWLELAARFTPEADAEVATVPLLLADLADQVENEN